MSSHTRIARSSCVFSVLDIGARFGLHETWSGFEGPAHFYLFEPDPDEAARLRSKYSSHENITLFQMALDEKEGERKLHLLKHRGGTSFLKPEYRSRYWRELRPNDGVIEAEVLVKTTAIDPWARTNKITVDFCKIDVEGAEAQVLRGASEQFTNNVLGVRSEVLFNPLFAGQSETFSKINEVLLSYGFEFLNFEPYRSNSQIPFSDLHTGERYGQLGGADAVWVKPVETLLPDDPKDFDPIKVLKYAYFAFRNCAEDLGMYVLQKSAGKGFPMTLAVLSQEDPNGGKQLESALFELEREVAATLFRLRDVPRYGSDYLRSVFESIFQKPWVGPGEYFQRYPLRLS